MLLTQTVGITAIIAAACQCLFDLLDVAVTQSARTFWAILAFRAFSHLLQTAILGDASDHITDRNIIGTYLAFPLLVQATFNLSVSFSLFRLGDTTILSRGLVLNSAVKASGLGDPGWLVEWPNHITSNI